MKQEGQKVRELAYVIVDTSAYDARAAVYAVAGSMYKAKEIVAQCPSKFKIVRKRFIEGKQ